MTDLGKNGLSCETYRKPVNKYLYVPRSSCHPRAVFSSIVASETCRLFRTNSRQETLSKQLAFFLNKFVDRGYSMAECSALISRQLARLRKPDDNNPRLKARKTFLKLPYSSSVNSRFLRRALSRHKHLIQNPVGLSFSVQKNLFRTLYQWNWGDTSTGEAG